MAGAKHAIWKPMHGFPAYEISNFGAVRRLQKARTRSAGYMPKGYFKDGYLHYKLATSQGKRVVRAHCAVLETFVGPCPEGMQAAHKDGKRPNNWLGNLRWATPKENSADRTKHGSIAGERNGRAKMTQHQVSEARAKFTGKYGEIAKLAREYNLSHSAMRDLLHGEHWRGRT